MLKKSKAIRPDLSFSSDEKQDEEVVPVAKVMNVGKGWVNFTALMKVHGINKQKQRWNEVKKRKPFAGFLHSLKAVGLRSGRGLYYDPVISKKLLMLLSQCEWVHPTSRFNWSLLSDFSFDSRKSNTCKTKKKIHVLPNQEKTKSSAFD